MSDIISIYNNIYKMFENRGYDITNKKNVTTVLNEFKTNNKIYLIENCLINNINTTIILWFGIPDVLSSTSYKLFIRDIIHSKIDNLDFKVGEYKYLIFYHNINEHIKYFTKFYSNRTDEKLNKQLNIIEYHNINKFYIDIISHYMMPNIKLIQNNTEKEDIYKRYGRKSLMKILVNDPVTIYFNAKIGDIFYFERNDNSIAYREVINIVYTK